MRRWFSALVLLPCLTAPAWAEGMTTPHPRLTWEQRFAQANASHDGHLTLEQAKAGYPSVARHFADIDTDKKGFVTQDDIRAWHKQTRAAHQPKPEPKLKPKHAFQREIPTVRASTPDTVPQPTYTVGPDMPAHIRDMRSPG